MNQSSQSKLLLGIGAISAALIAGYFGLDYFSGSKSTPAAPAAASASASGDYASAIASATEGGTPGAALTEDEAKRIGAEVARQVATEVAQAIVGQQGGSGASTSGGLSEEDARRIGAEEGRRVAEEVASAAVQQALAAAGSAATGGSGMTADEAEQIGLAAGRRAAEQVAARTARDVVRNEFGGSVAAAPKRREAVTATATDVAPAAPVSSKPRKAVTFASGSGSDALRAWWSLPASGEFGLVYAGQAKGESAIALLFSEPPADSALNQSVKVYDAKGELVSGSWEAAANPKLAVFRGLKAGRYTVVVDPALTDANGKALSKRQHGPVYIS